MQNGLETSGDDRTPGGISRRDQWHAVTAGYLGWTLDAFDFFVLVFLVDVLAVKFGAPKRHRGVLSGILQSGYSMGYLLAAVAARIVLPHLGWRAMFWVGGLPALLALYIRFNVKESEAWKQHRVPTMGAVAKTAISYWKIFSYLALLMTLMVFLSHGTQDLYPDFLKSAHGAPPSTVSYLAILYNVGAILGAIVFGHLSQSFGRRKGMIAALMLTMLAIPAWAFGGSLVVLAMGAFFVQAGVQGAWGIIPAHIN